MLIVKFLIGPGRIPVLALLAAITGAVAIPAAGVRVERSNESMNARSDARLEVYGEFKRSFGNDEDVVVAVTGRAPLDPATLVALDLITERAEGLDGVRSVYSLVGARQLVAGRVGAEAVAVVDGPLDSALTAQRLADVLDRNPHFTGLLVSADRRTAAVIIELEDRPTDDHYRSDIVDTMRALKADPALADVAVHVTGMAAQKYDVARLVGRDQAVLIPAAVVVLALVLFVCFRRLSAVVLALAVTGISLVWTIGIYALFGLALNTITSLLPPVIMVLSVATSVHLYHGWLEDVGPPEPAERLSRVVSRLWMPCAFTALTTAAGLLSLCISDTPAVGQFGVFAALGVLISVVVSMLLVPVGLSFLEPAARPRPDAAAWIPRALAASAESALSRPRLIVTSAVVVTVAAAALLPSVRNDTDLVRFLRPGAELRVDTGFVDASLGGVGAVEVVVSRGDGRPLTSLDDARRIADLADRFEAEPGVSGVIDVVDLLEQVQRAEFGGELRLPETEDDLYYVFDLLAEQGDDDDVVRRIIVEDLTRTRLSVRLRSMGSLEASALIERLELAAVDVLGSEYEVVTTGSFYHVALDSNRIVRNQVATFTLALVLVVSAIAAALRSWRLALVALAPNVFPIVWTGALMAVSGVELSTGTAMIASVVIGLAVDDTIHYLVRFRRELREHGGDCAAAIRATSTGVGVALAVTTVVLVLGFWVGALGSFLPTVYFSVLSGATMISALLCDLLVLPAGLVLIDRSGRSPVS